MSTCPTHGPHMTPADHCPFCKIEEALKKHADQIQILIGKHTKQAKADTKIRERRRLG